MSDLYHEVILEEFKHPQNYGSIADADLILRERNSSCGDEVTIYLKVCDENGQQKITDIKWEGQGCAISQAAMSVLSATIKQQGMTTQHVTTLTQSPIEELLGLDEISIGRIKCLLLGVQAFKKALQNKESK